MNYSGQNSGSIDDVEKNLMELILENRNPNHFWYIELSDESVFELLTTELEDEYSEEDIFDALEGLYEGGLICYNSGGHLNESSSINEENLRQETAEFMVTKEGYSAYLETIGL